MAFIFVFQLKSSFFETYSRQLTAIDQSLQTKKSLRFHRKKCAWIFDTAVMLTSCLHSKKAMTSDQFIMTACSLQFTAVSKWHGQVSVIDVAQWLEAAVNPFARLQIQLFPSA